MLYELSTLVATAGSTNRPVLQTQDRDPLHQYQVKNDKIRCFTNGYDTRYLFYGLFTHLDWTEHKSKTGRAVTYPIPIFVDTRTQNKHTQLDKNGIVKFRRIAIKAHQLRQQTTD